MRLAVVALVVWSGLSVQQSVPPAPAAAIAYDAFCGKSRMEKQDLFKTMTAEHKAVLWRTQIERWRAANQTRLTAEQRALLQDFHAIVPLAVARPRTADGDLKLKALEGRLTALFSEDDLKAMDNYGPCIAKKD
jgi:hypothetical protein